MNSQENERPELLLLPCEQCDQQFSTEKNLRQHEKKAHPERIGKVVWAIKLPVNPLT